jgi:uncharacterized protein (DUF1015 family)
MPLILPFRGLRPTPGNAAAVAAPPYDVVSSDEARAMVAGKPWSFLHISRPEIDLPAGIDVHSPAVYAKAAENLARMQDAGVLARDDQPCYYAYRLTMGDHVQTGLVATASVTAYDANRIRRHEFTRPDKEDDRVRQIEALNAQTGPVLLAYPPAAQADALLADATTGAPDADVTAADGIRHTLWTVRETAAIERITAAFASLPALYIADGHHRSAAASRVARARRGAAETMADYFLAVIFPHHQMKIMAYNRVVKDLDGLDEAGFLARVAERYAVTPSRDAVHPARAGTCGIYLPGRWFSAAIKPEFVSAHDAVARLDVSLLSDHLLGPVLGIADLRRDRRIDFVGGIRGLAELERRVDSGEMAVAFAMHATSMDDLMAVADSNQVMPPKSTWFEPKLADGLVSHVLD